VKPLPTLRLSVSRQESRQNDLGIVNHTWRFGASASRLFGSGLSFVGSYAFNRGDRSESDSYYASLSHDFGRFSLNASYSNTFRGVRFDRSSGEPVPVALADYQNIVGGVLVRLSRAFSAQIEYGGFLRSGESEHFLYLRMIYRSR
jgi:predicted porin